MKRLIVLALLALGLTIVAVPTATPAAPGDAKGPPCANITSGDGFYSLEGVIDFTVVLQDPACSFVTYSFVVTDTSGEVLATASPAGQQTCTPETGGGCVDFSVTLAGAPSTICIYSTTSIGRHLVDRAPNSTDNSCPNSGPSQSVLIDSSAAAGGFD